MPPSRETLEAIVNSTPAPSPTPSNTSRVRLRNEGYTQPGLHAVIRRISARYRLTPPPAASTLGGPPIGGGVYPETTDWWTAIERLPLPRIAVRRIHFSRQCRQRPRPEPPPPSAKFTPPFCELSDAPPSSPMASVRDLPAVVAPGFPAVRAASLSLTAILILSISAIQWKSSALRSIPAISSMPIAMAPSRSRTRFADRLPEAATRIREHERRIVDACQSPGFTPERLLEAIRSNS